MRGDAGVRMVAAPGFVAVRGVVSAGGVEEGERVGVLDGDCAVGVGGEDSAFVEDSDLGFVGEAVFEGSGGGEGVVRERGRGFVGVGEF